MLSFVTLLSGSSIDSNRHFSHSLTTTMPPSRIWEIWTDVEQWKRWDIGLKDAKLEAPIGLGAKGTILTLKDRKATFKIVEWLEGQTYTYKTRLPLGALYVKRTLSYQNGETVFTHEVWFSGLTAGIFARQFGGSFREMLPQVLANIKTIAES